MSPSGVYTADAKEGTYRIIGAADGKTDTSIVTVAATSVGSLAMSGSLLWNADAETGSWPSGTTIQQCASSRTKLFTASTKPYATAPNPRQGSWAAKLELWDSDKNCGGSSSTSIRTQVMSPMVMKNGAEYWVTESVYFPTDFPVVQDYWFMFTELYNPLGGGIPAVAFYVNKSGTVLRFAGDYDAATKGTRPLAEFPINKGRWHDFTLHIKVSTNPGVGFLELWHNGQNVQLKGATLVNSAWRVVGQTMLTNHATSGMGLFPNNYRSTSYTTSTGKTIVYFDRLRIGTTRNAVEGSTASATPLLATVP
jgi:hypothetical protein